MAKGANPGDLKPLQAVDERIVALRRRMAALPERLRPLEERIRAAEAVLRDAEQALEELKLEARRRELEVKEIDEKIARLEQQIQTVRKNEEYQALMKEAGAARADKKMAEDRLLDLWTQVEHSEKVRADRRGELEALRAEREQVVRETERERAHIEEQLAELGRERERLLDGVEGELLETYERILRSKEDGIALVRLRYVPGGRGRPDQYECEGCNVSTTLEVANEVIRARKPVQCPTCARLLYWEEPE